MVPHQGVADVSDEPLLLAGYQPVMGRGFALPCYGTAPVPNRWCVALAEVEGDHQTTIAGFDSFESDQIVLVTGSDLLRVAIGDAWRDVFLHEGEVYIGTPAEILTQLGEDRLEALRTDYPFEALDLALAAGQANAAELVRAAKAAVAQVHGEARAESWLGGLIVRPQARMEIRRQLVRAGLGDRQRDARAITVQARGDGWRVSGPPGLTKVLERAGASDALGDAAARVGDALALKVTAPWSERRGVVRTIGVAGNVRTPVDDILAATGIAVGDALSDDLLSRAADRVTRMGAFDSVVITHDEGHVILELSERPIVDRILLGGVGRLSRDHVRAHAALEAGGLYHPDLLEQWSERIHAVYDAVDIEVEVSFQVRTLSTQDRVTIDINVSELLDRRPTDADTDIFILGVGREARSLTRGLTQPDWSPRPDRFYSMRPLPPPATPSRLGPPLRIDIGHDDAHPDPTDYRVFVLLTVDDPRLVLSHLRQIEKTVARSGRRAPTVLIAPIPPSQGPSRVLRMGDIGPINLPTLLLDTTVLRSPFWRGGSPPAALRTLGDYALGAAMLIAGGAVDPSAQRLIKSAPLMAFTTDADAGPVRLMSETDPGRQADAVRPGDEVYRFPLYPRYGVPVPLDGFAHVSDSSEPFAFEDFAAAALQRTLRKKLPGRRPQRRRMQPGPWAERLTARDLAAILDKDDGVVAANGQALLIGEAPTLDLIVRADRQGLSVARYTDALALRHLGEERPTPPLPLDIALPDLRVQAGAVGWPARGAEVGRTIRRLSRDTASVLAERGRSPLSDRLRGLRAAVNDVWPAQVAAPLWETVEFGRGRNDPLALAFLRESPDQMRRPPSHTLPRGWTVPLPGAGRFVLPTAAAGLAVAHLPPDQIAGARLLQMDGDLSVPWLLTSRLFQIWVRSTCASVNGQYRITKRTLETFPWPDMVRFRREDPERPPALELADRHLLAALMEGDRDLWRGPVIAAGSESRIDEAPDLESPLFDAFGLRPFASDIDILDRLVAMNLSSLPRAI